MDMEEDRELIEQFLAGNEEAFHLLMSRHQRHVFYTVKAVLLDTEDARDVTQQAFIKAFRKLKRLKKKERFKSWLMRIAMNCAKDHLRKKRCECEFTELIPDRSQSVEGHIIARDAVRKVKKAIDMLAPRQRMILGLRLFREMDFEEIAGVLNIRPATARTNFHFGMKNLLKTVGKEGFLHEG